MQMPTRKKTHSLAWRKPRIQIRGSPEKEKAQQTHVSAPLSVQGFLCVYMCACGIDQVGE